MNHNNDSFIIKETSLKRPILIPRKPSMQIIDFSSMNRSRVDGDIVDRSFNRSFDRVDRSFDRVDRSFDRVDRSFDLSRDKSVDSLSNLPQLSMKEKINLLNDLDKPVKKSGWNRDTGKSKGGDLVREGDLLVRDDLMDRIGDKGGDSGAENNLGGSKNGVDTNDKFISGDIDPIDGVSDVDGVSDEGIVILSNDDIKEGDSKVNRDHTEGDSDAKSRSHEGNVKSRVDGEGSITDEESLINGGTRDNSFNNRKNGFLQRSSDSNSYLSDYNIDNFKNRKLLSSTNIDQPPSDFDIDIDDDLTDDKDDTVSEIDEDENDNGHDNRSEVYDQIRGENSSSRSRGETSFDCSKDIPSERFQKQASTFNEESIVDGYDVANESNKDLREFNYRKSKPRKSSLDKNDSTKRFNEFEEKQKQRSSKLFISSNSFSSDQGVNDLKIASLNLSSTESFNDSDSDPLDSPTLRKSQSKSFISDLNSNLSMISQISNDLIPSSQSTKTNASTVSKDFHKSILSRLTKLKPNQAFFNRKNLEVDNLRIGNPKENIDIYNDNEFNKISAAIKLKNQKSADLGRFNNQARNDDIKLSNNSRYDTIKDLSFIDHDDTLASIDRFVSPIKAFNAKPSSPWSKIRSSSTSPNKENKLFNGSVEMDNSDFTTVQRVNDLNKEITDYKIQLKFFKQFIQNLIDKSRDTNQDLTSLMNIRDLTEIREDITGEKSRFSKLKEDYDVLEKNYKEVYKLNEDLYENLEAFENEINDKNKILQRLSNEVDKSKEATHNILHGLMKESNVDEDSKNALMQCVNDNTLPLDLKLSVIKSELTKCIEKNYTMKAQFQSEMKNQVDNTRELISSVENLKSELAHQKIQRQEVETALQLEIDDSKVLKKNFESISSKFNQVCLLLKSEESENVRKSKPESIHSDNEQSGSDEYEEDITRIRIETQYSSSSKNVNGSPLHKQVAAIESDSDSGHIVLQLNNELQGFIEKYNVLQAETSKTIKDLTSQVTNFKDEVKIKEKELMKKNGDLELSNEKLKLIKSDKNRLSSTTEKLENEKQILLQNIQKLSDKVDQGEEKSKKMNIAEFQLRELISYDVNVFQKLWKSFDKIAEDNSFKEPTKRLNLLKRYLKGEQDPNLFEWEKDGEHNAREQHKYIFEYFARAVEILVNDHVRILLERSDYESKIKSHENLLRQRIEELEGYNDTLTNPNDTTNDIAKIKLEEMTKRFKGEREQRVYENKQAQRRLKELELENISLREMMDG